MIEIFLIFTLLTCVCLTAHADVSVTRHLGCLVVRRLILLGNLCVLLSQKGNSLSHVAIAHLQYNEKVFMLVSYKKRNVNSWNWMRPCCDDRVSPEKRKTFPLFCCAHAIIERKRFWLILVNVGNSKCCRTDAKPVDGDVTVEEDPNALGHSSKASKIIGYHLKGSGWVEAQAWTLSQSRTMEAVRKS